MNRKMFWLSIVTAVALGIIPVWGLDNNLTIMTEELPPFSYTLDNQQTGYAIEVVREILKRIGHADNIQILPWSRAVDTLEKKENTVVFSMGRTEQREPLYKWVGPLVEFRWVFFAKKGSGIKVSALEDAKKVKSIGTSLNSASHQLLVQNGFGNIDTDGDQIAMIKKLMGNRLDLWMTGDIPGYFIAKKNGFASSDMEPVFDIKTLLLYVAFNKNTSDEIVKKWQKTLDEIKADGTYAKIVAKYK